MKIECSFKIQHGKAFSKNEAEYEFDFESENYSEIQHRLRDFHDFCREIMEKFDCEEGS